MRLSTILAVLSLATASLVFLPTVDAAQKACLVTAPDCGGWVCVEQRADGYWSSSECVDKRDLDTCQFQSDCCGGINSFWCPETESS